MRIPRALALITLGALSLRVAWVVLRWQQAGTALEFDDERLHWELARNLAAQGDLISDDGRYAPRMPGYPLLLWPCAELGGHGILVAKLMQCVLGAAAVAVAMVWLRAAAGPVAAALAGVLIAVDPYGIFFCNLLLTETPFSLAALGFTWALWTLHVRGSVEFSGAANQGTPLRGAEAWWLAILGPVLVMLRPSAAAWVALTWLLVLMHVPLRKAGLVVARCALVAGILFLPWGLRNVAVLGQPAWLSTNGGWTLYDAQGPRADGGSAQQHFAEELPGLRNLDELGQDALLRHAALEQMRRDPARVLRLAWVKLARTWNPIPNFSEYRTPIVALASAAYTIPLVLLGLGAWRWMRRDAALLITAWLPVLTFTVLHMFYVGSLRYRVPLMPFLAVCAAVSIVRIGGGPVALRKPGQTG